MYCRKCGKQIDYDARVCKECEETEAFFGPDTPEKQQPPVQQKQPAQPINPYAPQPPYYYVPQQSMPQPMPMQGSNKKGFGVALTAVILGGVAEFLSAIAAELVATGYMVMALLALGCAIPALILGIKSIKLFFSEKKAGNVKPIPTFVMGLIGTILSGSVLLSTSLSLLLIMALS